MKISDETKVGILAAFGITILIIGYSFLRGKNFFEKRIHYYAIYTNVEGLTTSDPVTFNGLPVGKVMSLKLMKDGSGRAIAKILMQEEINIPKNSGFQLYSSDLLGEKAVKLILGNSTELALDGDTLTGDIAVSLTEEMSKQLLPVKQKAENLFGSLDSTLQVIQVILKGGGIDSSLHNIERATGSFDRLAKNLDILISQQRETLGRIFTNLENITSNLDSNSQNITMLFENLAQLSDTLSQANIKQAVGNLNNTLAELQTLLKKVNEGDGTVGMLVNDKKLYDNLTAVTANLESLLADVEANPKRYVHFSLFGGGSDKKKETEKPKSTP